MPPSPEWGLMASVLIRALHDLRAHDERIRDEAQSFFEHDNCAWLCDLLGVDMKRVQATARAIVRGQQKAPTLKH